MNANHITLQLKVMEAVIYPVQTFKRERLLQLSGTTQSAEEEEELFTGTGFKDNIITLNEDEPILTIKPRAVSRR